MNTSKMDIVYFVKDGTHNEEFRHSLRSVCKNMPNHGRIWVFGGCPRNIVPDVRIRVHQEGKTKWDKVRAMFKMACENKELSEDFILFNDDFFVMKPIEEIKPLYHCTLDERIEQLPFGPYRNNLQNTCDFLKERTETPLSYELHVPFVFNKKKLLKLIEEYPDLRATRSSYGNIYNIGGEQSDDVKVFSDKPSFDFRSTTFLSTDDGVVNVNNGIWRYIKNEFKTKCEYEI